MAVEKKHVIFIVGMPRSSTSIIHRTLAQHPDIFCPTLSDILFPSDRIIDRSLKALFQKIPQSFFDKVYRPEVHRTGPTSPEAIDVALFKKFKRGVLSWVHKDALNNVTEPEFVESEDLPYLQQMIMRWQENHNDKHVCVKYFHGLLHLDALRSAFPDAKIVLPLRNPETLVYSSATLLKMVMDFRNKRVPNSYWQNIYNNIVLSYNSIAELLEENRDDIHVVSEELLKADFNKELQKVFAYVGVGEQKMEPKKKYERQYEYSTEMNQLYRREDFSSYFAAVANLNS